MSPSRPAVAIVSVIEIPGLSAPDSSGIPWSRKLRELTPVVPYASLDASRVSAQFGDQPIILRRLLISCARPARIPNSRRLVRTCRCEHGIVRRPLDIIDRVRMRCKQPRLGSRLLFLFACHSGVCAGRRCGPDPLSGFPSLRNARVALVRVKDPDSPALGCNCRKAVLRSGPRILGRMGESTGIGWRPFSGGGDHLVWIRFCSIDVEQGVGVEKFKVRRRSRRRSVIER
jgi:hypothetical protein